MSDEHEVWNDATGRFEPRPKVQRHLQLNKVPLDWLGKASQLPGRALEVSLSIWALAIAVNKNTVMVTPKNVETFQVSASAKARALTALARAGLITVERRRGRFPVVTLVNPDAG